MRKKIKTVLMLYLVTGLFFLGLVQGRNLKLELMAQTGTNAEQTLDTENRKEIRKIAITFDGGRNIV